MIYFTTTDSPLGIITLSSDGTSLTGLWLDGQKYFPDRKGWSESADLPVFLQTRQWLRDYFSGAAPDPKAIVLSPAGTPFQMQVWQQLLEIPYGQTITYGTLAQSIHCPSPQAVGNAVGRNPISIVIPCHRVVGRNGQLTGYAGGLHRKQWLLELEKINL